ncbi:hypothetical protein [Patulibacter sp.]|uniref:hypothetical protein n=1 Tax=Patulibacter sp. TaxID=1912859 RepID=UPI00271D7CFC|nr:hypothetical protein [Patulibacter sp.]MDO9409178.1 hypothetical protein [Patulibacter sp.]
MPDGPQDPGEREPLLDRLERTRTFRLAGILDRAQNALGCAVLVLLAVLTVLYLLVRAVL